MRYISVLTLLMLVSGCSKSDSGSIASDEIYATLEVIGNGDKLNCKAYLTVGGPTGTLLSLTDNDSLHCALGDTQATFKGSPGSYTATGLTYTVGETYKILFSRGQGQCVAKEEQHTSSVKLPTAIAIASPASGTTQDRTQDLTVTWTASNASRVQITISGKKMDSNNNQVDDFYTVDSADDGTETISKSRYTSWLTTPGIKLSVRRLNDGTFASSLKGGSISAVQSAEASLGLSGSPSVAQDAEFVPEQLDTMTRSIEEPYKDSISAKTNSALVTSRRCRY